MMSSIAEGSGRRTAKDTRRYLVVARGSATELESQAILSHDLGYLSAGDFATITANVDSIRAMLVGLSRNLRTS